MSKSAGENVSSDVPPPLNDAVSRSMRGNKRSDTKPELALRKALRENGLSGYRLQWHVPGRPDIAYPGRRIAIFVNGCFWHRCPMCKPALPKTHVEFWEAKFERNVARDSRNKDALESDGWTVLTVWECEIKGDLPAVVSRIRASVKPEGSIGLNCPRDGGSWAGTSES